MTDATVSTVTIDSYSTLVDVDAQVPALREHIPEMTDAESISQLWRSQYILYSLIANEIDAYRPFWELIGEGLEYALRQHGYEVDAAVRDAVRATVYEERLTVFDDVQGGVSRIVDAGYDVYVLSNGTPTMLTHLLEAAGLTDVVTDAISADEVETYKPHPRLYEHAAARTDTPIGEVLHVSGGNMRDVWGAKSAGMQTAWLCRPSQPAVRESLGPAPDMTVTDFHDVADQLIG